MSAGRKPLAQGLDLCRQWLGAMCTFDGGSIAAEDTMTSSTIATRPAPFFHCASDSFVLKLYSEGGRPTAGRVQDMMWLEHTGANRALAVSCWLGTTIIAQSWRLSLTGITTTLRRLRAAGASVRMAPVSQAWLREYDAECVKHEDAR